MILPRPEKQPVTVRTLLISIASLAVPVIAAFWFPDWTSGGFGMLVWLTALIPAFLLAYYRGLSGVALALAGGMAVITATQLSISLFDIADPDWMLLLSIVGVYLAVSVGIAGLAEVLRRERRAAEEMALSDRLTGLPNRRHVDVVLAREFAAAERGHALTVVAFDLDRFKQLNDTHGHAAGDATIRAFAAVLLANTRRENISARYGGEEFVSVLRDANQDGARIFAQRVLDQFRQWEFKWGSQTVSAGIASFVKGMGSPGDLIQAADRALYQAKEGGRDAIGVADQSGGAPGPAARVPPSRATPVRPVTDVPPARSALRVLLISHVAQDRTGLRNAISARGHTVWDTGDPREAVRRFAASSPADQPEVVITDVKLPEMNGYKLIEVIAAISPGIRVVYVTGSGEAPPAGENGAVIATLRRPVNVERLLSALDETGGR